MKRYTGRQVLVAGIDGVVSTVGTRGDKTVRERLAEAGKVAAEDARLVIQEASASVGNRGSEYRFD